MSKVEERPAGGGCSNAAAGDTAASSASDWAPVIERVVSSGGHLIKDRRRLFTTFPKCMTGKGLVDWLEYERMRGATTRAKALEVAQAMLSDGAIVSAEHKPKPGVVPVFKDSDSEFYRIAAFERTQDACSVAQHWRAL